MLTDVVIANRNYTKLTIAEGQIVDEIALKVMKQDCPDFLLPIKIMEIDGEQELRYEQQEGVRLCYSSMKMYKKDFMTLLENMLLPFRTCNDWFLDYHNILLDANYVLLGRKDYTVKYIYVPVAEYARTDTEIIEFFSNIVLKADIQDDSRYAIELLRVLRGDNSNLMTLLDFVSRDEMGENRASEKPRREAPGPEKQKPEAPVDSPYFGTRASQPEPPKSAAEESRNAVSGPAARPGQMAAEFGKKDVQGQLVGSLFDDEDEPEPRKKKKSKKASKPPKESKEKSKPARGGGLFNIFKGKSKGEAEDKMSASGSTEDYAGGRVQEPLQWDRPVYQESVSGSMTDDVTELFDEEEVGNDGTLRLRLIDSAGYDCPKLVEIDLSQGFATVGRRDKNNQAQSDYCFDASLSFISRRHFRVEREEDHWVIIDLGSGNGTLVNGEQLLANVRHPLYPGDTIMISLKRRLAYQVC